MSCGMTKPKSNFSHNQYAIMNQNVPNQLLLPKADKVSSLLAVQPVLGFSIAPALR